MSLSISNLLVASQASAVSLGRNTQSAASSGPSDSRQAAQQSGGDFQPLEFRQVISPESSVLKAVASGNTNTPPGTWLDITV